MSEFEVSGLKVEGLRALCAFFGRLKPLTALMFGRTLNPNWGG